MRFFSAFSPIALASGVLLSLGALVACSYPAHATLIDFETFPDASPVPNNTTISNQYASLGVTFSQFENGVQIVGPLATNTFASTAGSGNGLYNVQTGVFPATASNRADILRMSFTNPVGNVSFVTNGLGDVTTFQAFDSSGTLLQTITNTGGALLSVTFNVTGISRVDALQNDDTNTYRIDNLNFTPVGGSAAPEPGTLALFGMGALPLAGLIRRRRRK